MKKFIILLLLVTIPVHANIICNDGTESPSCTNCHSGCCSHHGGCANNNYENNSESNSNYNNESTKRENSMNTSVKDTTISDELRSLLEIAGVAGISYGAFKGGQKIEKK